MTDNMDFDLVIIGGGMVGASLALAVAESGLKIAIIEAQKTVEQRPSFDDRAIALAYGSQKILHSMGLWADLAPFAEAIKTIHVSEQGQFGFTRIKAEEEQLEALGYVITAKSLGQVFLQKIAEQPQIQSLNATLHCFSVDQQKIILNIENNQGEKSEITSRLLIAADGIHSLVRKQLNIPIKQHDYQQSAVTANIETDLFHQNIAYERFCQQGPLALLPMTESRCGLVWTHSTENIDAVLKQSDAVFMANLQKAFGFRLGRIKRVGERQAYPLSFKLATQFIHQRVALIGNAAHALHPIAGQGYNLGLRDVAALAEVLTEAHQQQQDIGSDAVLKAYQAWRQNDQKTVGMITDGLVKLFTTSFLPLRLARNLGMVGIDLFPPAKHLISQQAMGLRGKLPYLARQSTDFRKNRTI